MKLCGKGKTPDANPPKIPTWKYNKEMRHALKLVESYENNQPEHMPISAYGTEYDSYPKNPGFPCPKNIAVVTHRSSEIEQSAVRNHLNPSRYAMSKLNDQIAPCVDAVEKMYKDGKRDNIDSAWFIENNPDLRKFYESHPVVGEIASPDFVFIVDKKTNEARGVIKPWGSNVYFYFDGIRYHQLTDQVNAKKWYDGVLGSLLYLEKAKKLKAKSNKRAQIRAGFAPLCECLDSNMSYAEENTRELRRYFYPPHPETNPTRCFKIIVPSAAEREAKEKHPETISPFAQEMFNRQRSDYKLYRSVVYPESTEKFDKYLLRIQQRLWARLDRWHNANANMPR
ncbi:MAG: hypothetical protein LBR41_02090 [Rickettsiales bacterium]|jgi:hypothetical protein|nr:hypothetical protein [Rickettsiales bacterium]